MMAAFTGGRMATRARLKRFISDVKDGVTPQTLWLYSDVGHTQEAKQELLAVLEFRIIGGSISLPQNRPD